MNPTLKPLAVLFLGLAATALDARSLDPRDYDTATAACKDFYQHANGGWLKTNPVPAGRPSIGLFDQLNERTAQQRLALIDSLGAGTGTADPLADFVASGLDAAAAESGAALVGELLAPLDRLKKPKDVPPLIAELHRRGLPVLFQFTTEAGPDGKQIAVARAVGLGLPDTAYYLREDADTRELLGRYRAYAETLLKLSGSTDPSTDSAWLIDMEVRLARIAAAAGTAAPATPPVKLRAQRKAYPQLAWKEYLKAQGLKKLDAFAVRDAAWFAELDRLVAAAPAAQWKAYLRFHVTHALAPYLGAEYVAAHDLLFRNALRGERQPPARNARVLAATERHLGEWYAQRYVATHVPANVRDRAVQIADDVRRALDARLADAAWLTPAQREAAQAKLRALRVRIAEAPAVPELTVTFDRSRYAANVLALAVARRARQFAAIGTAMPAADAVPPPQQAALYYDPAGHQLVVGAGMLQPPLFDPDDDLALQYGGFGALVGHELTHSVDAVGNTFAGDGTLQPQWDAAAQQAFAARLQPLVAQYGKLAALGGRRVDGARTLAENFADLSGIELAWHAFAARAGDTTLPRIDTLTPAQRFFLAYARTWRQNVQDDAALATLERSPQAPARQRVLGALPNVKAFADAFACKPKQPMHLAPAERVVAWPVEGGS